MNANMQGKSSLQNTLVQVKGGLTNAMSYEVVLNKDTQTEKRYNRSSVYLVKKTTFQICPGESDFIVENGP